MLPILTPSECAALDRESAARGVSVETLMENAGRAVARAAVAMAGGAYGRRAIVVCGKGSNGGDGLVAARCLERSGMGVSVVGMAEPSSYRGSSATNLRRFVGGGGRWRPFSPTLLARELDRAHVIIDAIFGTGFHGAPEGDHAMAVRAMNAAAAPIVAVDIPSGVEGETGAVRSDAVHAGLTVTFGALKPGLVFDPGAGFAGAVEVADIGFPPDLVRSELWMVERSDVAALLRPRARDSHKRSTGVVLVIAGSRAMTGAAVLAAKAAYRAGAGLVTLAAPQSILSVLEAALTEATFLPLLETSDGTISEQAWTALEDRLAGVDAIAVGPGLTTNPETAALVRRLVTAANSPLVLDADGLNAFTGRTEELADHTSDMVITPHAGEFGRLMGMAPSEVLEDRVGHARKAASGLRLVVLLKGSRTVVAEPDGSARVNPTGGPFLATGGTGDVLTGAIGAFLSRGLRPAEAATLAAYVHGEAGRRAAALLGEGTNASDVLEALPLVIHSLGQLRE
jgi:hydroxyethylthiazole kinase-like uncharacterized protein yjeF